MYLNRNIYVAYHFHCAFKAIQSKTIYLSNSQYSHLYVEDKATSPVNIIYYFIRDFFG